ncbi:MAG: Zn-ribbon domain-containing OB-fold protein [Methanomassiliicoccales archaeon]|nr:Zn-ribbon domain-containing OB-fold protein [Methanomassiliicoccales archaeon]
MSTARFWRENPSRYNMTAVRCGVCKRILFPPRSICPACRRKSVGKLEEMKLRGEGEIYSFSIVHEAPSQLDKMKPYVIAIVQMDEGVRVTGQIIDCEPSDVKIGMRVRSTLRKLGEDGEAGVIHYGYKFIPVKS